jgi:hypothetical protein
MMHVMDYPIPTKTILNTQTNGPPMASAASSTEKDTRAEKTREVIVYSRHI